MGLPRLKRVLCAALAALLLALASAALADVTVYIAPYSGTKYHSRKSCSGLNNARYIRAYQLSELPSKYKPCSLCASGSKYKRSSSSSSKATKKPTANPTSKPTAVAAAVSASTSGPLATAYHASYFDAADDDREHSALDAISDMIWLVTNYPLQVFLVMLAITLIIYARWEYVTAREKKRPPGPVVRPRSDSPRPFNPHPSGVPNDTRLAYFGSNAIYDLGNAPPRPGCVPVYIANGCTLYHYYRDCPQLRTVPDEQIMRVDFRVAQKMGYTACDICRGRIYSGPDKYKMLNQLYGDSQRRPPY